MVLKQSENKFQIAKNVQMPGKLLLVLKTNIFYFSDETSVFAGLSSLVIICLVKLNILSGNEKQNLLHVASTLLSYVCTLWHFQILNMFNLLLKNSILPWKRSIVYITVWKRCTKLCDKLQSHIKLNEQKQGNIFLKYSVNVFAWNLDSSRRGAAPESPHNWSIQICIFLKLREQIGRPSTENSRHRNMEFTETKKVHRHSSLLSAKNEN